MTSYTFTLVLRGPDPTSPEIAGALEAAGCDDALFGVQAAVPFADFDREAATMGDAVLSAIRDVETVPQLTVLRVEPDELITASGIAARIGRTRESVRLLIEGRRGPGGFPPPVARLDRRTRLWRWTEVSQWLADALGMEVTPDSAMLAAINAWLELRRYGQSLRLSERRGEFAHLVRDESKRLSA